MNVFEQTVRWLRAGYPKGVPHQDYIALYGVLHHNLTDKEIERVARAMREQGALDEQVPYETIEHYIRSEVHQRPHEADVRRVIDHLVAGGFPRDLLERPED